MTLALRAGQEIDGVSWYTWLEGTRWGRRGGKVAEPGTKGRARWARSSRGRRVLILVLVRESQGSGPVRGFLHLVGLSELGSLNENGAGKLDGSQAAAMLMGEGVQASVTAANLLL